MAKRRQPQPVDPARIVGMIEASLGIGQRKGFVITVKIHVPTRNMESACQKVAHHLRHKTFDCYHIRDVFDCRRGFSRPVPNEYRAIRFNRQK